MDIDNQYYDSLDEDEFPELLSLRRHSADINISQIVPLYGREMAKSEVITCKSKSNKPRNKLTLPTRNDSNSQTSGSLSQLFLDSRQKKSYVDLFHAKIGYVHGTEPTDTTRGICDADSFQTARTSAESLDHSDGGSAVSFVSDSSSFYIKFMENEKALSNQLRSISCCSSPQSRTNSTVESSQHPATFSRSTQNFTNRNAAKTKSTKCIKFDKAMLKVPTLGGLGPDRESSKDKLERLKRQQRYGQKVSNQNRMKIRETKVMKNFKYELKKSSDLNKCAESVLGS